LATTRSLLDRAILRLGTTLAVLLAMGAQTLLSNKGLGVRWGIIPGLAVYAVAAFVFLVSRRRRERHRREGALPGDHGDRERREDTWTLPFAWEWGLVALIILGGGYLRVYRIDIIPPGLNNDEAINALEAREIVDGKPFSTITERGLNRESLFHHLAAVSFEQKTLALNSLRAVPGLFGLLPRSVTTGGGIELLTQILPLRIVAIGVGTLTLLALYLFARSRFGWRVALLATLLLAVSPWHLLYSRVGLRAILAPLFAIVTIGLFLRALDTGRLRDHLAWGVILGLGFWTYTSFRVIPLAIVAFLLLRRVLDPVRARKAIGRRPVLMAGGIAAALIVLIIVLSGTSLKTFLLRGAYASMPGQASYGWNLLHAATMLNYLPAGYGVIQSRGFISDGVSATYPLVGFEPETVPVAALATLGLLCAAWSLIAGRRDPTLSLILLCVIALILVVGPMGPSLTRMLQNVPWICLLASMVAWQVADELAALWRPLGRVIAATAVVGIATMASVQGFEQYFLKAGRSERAMQFFWPNQTVMGLFVRSGLPPDPIVYILHSYGRETLTYLVGDRPDVYLINDPGTLDLNAIGRMKRSAVFIVEYSEYSRPFAEVLRYLVNEFRAYADMSTIADPRFDPDDVIFYKLVLWKDASGQLIAPPGAGPSVVPGAPLSLPGEPSAFPDSLP
jgi:hypothetical protein